MDPTISMATMFDPSQLGGGADAAMGRTHSIVQPSAEQIDKFQNLMSSQPGDSHAIVESRHVEASNGENVVRRSIDSQDASMQQMVSDISGFSQASATMPATTAIAEAGRLSMEISLTTANMQAKQGVVESSKSSLQTLLKNQ
ncbi:hypothetical protein [Paraburkholderia youngii]|uniref:hypothetical protein n=1 Tax=Paraburkholderia youngii TaxID=2782701 RepID=UPI003D257D64